MRVSGSAGCFGRVEVGQCGCAPASLRGLGGCACGRAAGVGVVSVRSEGARARSMVSVLYFYV